MRIKRTSKMSATEFNRAMTAMGAPGRDPQIDALTAADVQMLEDICGYELARPPSAGLVPVPAMHFGRLRYLQSRGELPADVGAAMVTLNELSHRTEGLRPFSDDLMANMLSWMSGRGVDVGAVGRSLLSRHTHVNRYA